MTSGAATLTAEVSERNAGRPFAPYANTLLSEIAVRNWTNYISAGQPDPRSSP